MKKKNNRGILFIKLLICFMYFGTCFLMKNSGGKELLLNFVFLAVMYVLILKADIKGIRIMDSVAYDNRRIKDEISQLSQEKKGKEFWEVIRKDETLCFSDSFIQDVWKEYLDKEIPEPLENYLSEEFIYEKVNKSFCDMVPGILTALGILGTFIGLIISMSSFEFSNMELMGNMLENIMGGIHVAFYTSVYGVCLSIVYNLVYRRSLQRLRDNLYDFYNMFRGKLGNIDTDEGDTQQIINSLCEEKQKLDHIVRILENDMPDKIGEALGDSIAPCFDEINKSLKRVIGDFREEQAASLQNIVTSFVQHMHYAMDSHMNELGKSVDHLSHSQSQMAEDMRTLLGEIRNTARDTKKINKESAAVLSKFEEYMEVVNRMVVAAEKTYEIVEVCAKEIHSTVSEQSYLFKTMENYEKQFLEAGNGFSEQMKKNADTAENMRKSQEVFAENQREMIKGLNQYTQKISDSILELKAAQSSVQQEYKNYWNIFEAKLKLQETQWDSISRIIEGMTNYEKQKKDESGKFYSDRIVQPDIYQQQQICLNRMLIEYLEKMNKKEEKKFTSRVKRFLRKIMKRH